MTTDRIVAPSARACLAMLAASSVAYAHSATSLLDEVGAHPDVDPQDHWTDQGGSWQPGDLVGTPGHQGPATVSQSA